MVEPELTAEVVVAAGYARNPRLEYWVGTPTVEAIIGQKIIPGLLDRYLGALAIDRSRFRMSHVI